MSTIVFPNGKRVKFDGTPTPEDVDFVAKQIGITESKPKSEPSLMDNLRGAGSSYLDFQKGQANQAIGVLEGATLGIPRAIVEQTVGRGVGALTGDQELQDKLMNLPRGGQAGQVIGSFMGLGALTKGAKAIPALAGSNALANLLRGASTGAVAANTPLFTPKDDTLGDRGMRTALGAATGGAFEIAAPIVGKAAQATGSFLKKTPKFVKSVFESGKNLGKANVEAENITQKIESLRDSIAPAKEALNDASVSDAILYKNKIRPISKANSKIYREGLDLAESQANITGSKVAQLLDDSINEALDQGISTDSQLLRKMGELSERLKPKASTDYLTGTTQTADERLSIKQLRDIKNTLFKLADKSEDHVDEISNAIFMKNYGGEIAKQSDSFGAMQSEYAPYVEAKKWAYRTFKPFTKDEIPNGNRVLRAIAKGTAKAEDYAYLERLEGGSGRFVGTGQMRGASQSMANQLKNISDEIRGLRSLKVKNTADIQKLERLVKLRDGMAIAAISALPVAGATGVAAYKIGKNV